MKIKKWMSLALATLTALTLFVPSMAETSTEESTKEEVKRIQYTYQSKHLSTSDEPKDTEYDVIVFGSDPEGIAAAYSASKQGLKTLLVDFGRDRVGGLYTLGWLNMIDFNYATGEDNWYGTVYKDNFLNHGIFERFYNMIGEKKAFDISDAQTAFEKLLAGAKVEVVLTSDEALDYSYDAGQKTNYITINKDSSPTMLSAKVVIDALPNADIAGLAGVQFKDGKEDVGLKGKYQSATLVYKIKGVDWDKVRQELMVNDKDPDTGVNQNAAWGYKQMLDAPVNNPKMQSRHLNLGRQNDGTVIVNAFQIFDFDPYDKDYQAQTREEAIRRIKEDIIPYMRKNLYGFENAEFVAAAPEFYIRENKHMIGEETLTANDVFDSAYPSNFIASGSYPIDIQARHKGDIGTILTGTKPYGISAGVITPKDVEGIYVPSKAASMDSIAYGSARTVPVLMALGEAAGAMAKVALVQDVSTSAIYKDPQLVSSARSRLYDQGVRLVSYTNSHPIGNSYAYDEIRELRGRALITMTYQNQYGLEQKATTSSIETMLTLMANNSAFHVKKTEAMALMNKPSGQQLRLSDLLPLMNYFTEKDYASLEDYKEAGILSEKVYENLGKKGYLVDQYGNKIASLETASQAQKEKYTIDTFLTHEDLYALMGSVIPYTPRVTIA